MSPIRISLAAAVAALSLSSVAMAQPSTPAAATREQSPLCKPDTKIEILSEGAWYPGVALDALRDGRCFVHYDTYTEDDDEAVAAKLIRSAR